MVMFEGCVLSILADASNLLAKMPLWAGIDALADVYSSHSTYNYTLNNPTVHIDPDENDPDWFHKRNDNNTPDMIHCTR